jgi:hypothetical protein
MPKLMSGWSRWLTMLWTEVVDDERREKSSITNIYIVFINKALGESEV